MGYLVLDTRSGYEDGKYNQRARAQAVCEDLAAIFPCGNWKLAQVGHDYWMHGAAWDRLQTLSRFYGFDNFFAAAEASEARRKLT